MIHISQHALQRWAERLSHGCLPGHDGCSLAVSESRRIKGCEMPLRWRDRPGAEFLFHPLPNLVFIVIADKVVTMVPYVGRVPTRLWKKTQRKRHALGLLANKKWGG